MAYYAPPGGSLTARVARSLQDTSMNGLGILPSINVRSSRIIPAAIGAARRFRAEQLPPDTTMTGMGVVTVRPPGPQGRYAQPAPVTFAAARTAAALRLMAAQAAGQPTSMNLAGPKAHRMGLPAMPTVGNVRRQAAMFMTPGGGYSQIPGFMPAIGPPMVRISGLGQEDTTMIPAGDTLTPPTYGDFTPVTLIPTPSIPIEPSSYTAPTTLTAPPSTPSAVQNVPLPKGAVMIAPSAVPFLPSAAQSTFMTSSPLGVSNKYLIAAAAGIVLLTLFARRRRRNPGRRRRA